MTVCFAPCPVIFDLDGTLIDSAPDIHACVNAALRSQGYGTLSLQQVRSFVGGGVDTLWNRIIAATGIEQTARRDLKAAFMARYQVATALTRLFPGVEDALGVLADRGHPMGICTNKPLAPTRHILQHFGIEQLFSDVIGGDSLPQKKPDPAPLLASLANLGGHPDQRHAIYVGDSEYDAECAAAAGVPFLLFTKGYRNAPVRDLPNLASFDDFAALPALIEAHIPA